ncbi:MAG: hypothetical protein JJT76_06295 [Clostridiaceae bacterium]|nr:hypothetical protein [Clostridiaceae bacterium]
MGKKNETLKKLDKMIDRIILHSDRFIEFTAFPYGLNDLEIDQIDSAKVRLVYDYEYFVFTKSTKTLRAIRELLNMEMNEDALILVRSMFEGYLSCRYLHENNDRLDDFIANPIKVSFAHFNINPSGEIVDREKNIKGKIINPSQFKTGMDKRYYYDFYDYLSRFAHCNFSIIDSYIDENTTFTHKKIHNEIASRLFAVFVATKIFELVVTVEGEEFINKRAERNCYKLVKDSLVLQEFVFEESIKELSVDINESIKYMSKRLKEMFKNMKKSLAEELGSIKK